MHDIKKQMAEKLMQKLGSLNPSDIQAITIQLVMKDGGVDMADDKEEEPDDLNSEMSHSEGPDEKETSDEAKSDTEEVKKDEYNDEEQKKKREFAKREAFKQLR